MSSGEFISQLLNIPPQFKVLNMVTVGYPVKQRAGKSPEELQYDKIRKNRFQ